MDSLQWIQQLHLIRPYWLFAIIPLAFIIWLYARTQSQNHNWASVIDKRLLKHLLNDQTHIQKKPTPVIVLFTLGLIIIFALAGPAFEKRPQPVFENQASMVIILDLSRSMDATDIKPTRLNRAKFKIDDIIAARKDGQTALIVYAADAYVVSPLTSDADTIAAQVPALETTIMPAQGSRLDIALEKAMQLFMNAGQAKGDILVITDSISGRDIQKIRQLSNINYNTSILAVGTQQGAPISTENGGFIKDKNGTIVIPQLTPEIMREAASVGNGRFSLISSTDNDIDFLLARITNKIDTHNTDTQKQNNDGPKFKTDLWHEEGPWLILLIIPFAAYAFRKGIIFLLVLFILPLPQPAQAFGWTDLWQNKDQQGKAQLQQGNAAQAADLFNSPEWKAAAQYKAGNFKQSAELLKDIDTAEANYNRGNALAKAGYSKEAIKAYDKALTLDPKHEDAQFNKKLLEKQEENKSNKAKSGGDSSDKKDEQTDKDKEKKEQNKEDKDSESKEGDDKKNESKDGQSKDDKPKDSDSKQDNKDSADKKESDKESDKGKESDKEPSKENDSDSKPGDESQKGKNKQPEQSDEDATKNQPKDEKLTDEDKQKISDTETESENEQKKQQDKDDNEAKNKNLNDERVKPNLKQQQTQQWLKKIPDDPGGLLRRKFKYQYSRQQTQEENQPW